MVRRRIALLRQVLLFVLVTLLGIATGYLTNERRPPAALKMLERWALPLAIVIAIVIVAVMIWHQVAEERGSPAPTWDSARPPFPGLEAFTEQDAGVFFGRAAEASELLERLHPVEPAKAHRLIAVIGPSGVGKSSLVSAGVLPRLAQRRQRWIVVPPFVPEDRPIRSLARSLAEAARELSADRLAVMLAAGPHGLADCVAEVRAVSGGRSSPVLVTIDQGEELLTLTGDQERGQFLALLENSLAADQRLWIVVIMRSEFLTAFLATPHARLFRDPVTVGALGRDALYDVITGPAAKAGLRFDPPELTQLMVDDAGGGDALPLLAYTLQELYLAAGKSMVVTAADYRHLNGVTGALTRQADKVTAELDAGDAGSPVLATLLKFVAFGENGPTRRRVRRGSLDPAGRRVADAFVSARLLVTSAGPDDGDAVIEVAHEALFRHWAPLRQEIEAHAEELQWRADLERWALDWERSGRQDAYLLRAERLKTARQLAASAGDLAPGTPLVVEFLDRSSRADRTAREQLSVTLARQALGEVDQDPERSLLLALAAVEECAPTPAAQRALATALPAARVRGVLRGHEHAVTAVDWSRDGTRIATASTDHTARIWDASTYSRLLVLRHDDEVRAVAWSPDGTRVATMSTDRSARIWDAATARPLVTMRGHSEAGWGVTWSPTGDRVATSSNDCTTRIWDASTGAALITLRGHEDHTEEAAWSPDGARIATVSSDASLRIWDTASGSQLMVLKNHERNVRGVAWSPDGMRLASSSNDATIRIWDADSGAELLVLRGHGHTVGAVAWSPDGTRLATASSDRTIRIWDGRLGTELLVLHARNISPFRVSWSPDGTVVAAATDDRTAQIWDAGEGLELRVLRGHESIVRAVTWSPDGVRIASASDDRTTRIWRAGQGTEVMRLGGHDQAVRAVCWSPDGGRLATGSSDCTARVWDPATGTELLMLSGHDRAIWGLAWSPDGRRIVTASIDQTLQIWDAETATVLATLAGHDDAIRWVAWSPDGQRLASASNDRTARIWNPDTGAELRVLRGHDQTVRAVTWSPDGRRVVTGADDRTALVWDSSNGSQLAVLEGHDGWVLGAAWSPGGDQIATASADGTIRIWDPRDGSQLLVAGVQADRAEGLTWSPDGTRLASASRDGTVRVWDATVNLAALVQRAHTRVLRSLTADERRSLMLPAEVPAEGAAEPQQVTTAS
jgi:WD40 repeat protein